MRRALLALAALIGIAAAYLLAWPTRIDPVAVTVGPNPGFTGLFAPNEALRGVSWLGTAMGRGPEDVWVSEGLAFTGLEDGRVMRVRIDAANPETAEQIAHTNGRPLGLQLDRSGNLVVADARRGLLAITSAGKVSVLADRFENQPLKFVDDLDIATDGTIYFTDASQRFGLDEDELDFMEGRATGRLLAFDPHAHSLQMKLDALSFANGVALGPGDEYVLVNETTAHRVTRLWLKGPKAGTREAFVENLPGYPDNISFNGRDGSGWRFSDRV